MYTALPPSPLSPRQSVLCPGLQVLNGGRFFDREGNRVRQEGEQYHSNGVRQQY